MACNVPHGQGATDGLFSQWFNSQPFLSVLPESKTRQIKAESTSFVSPFWARTSSNQSRFLLLTDTETLCVLHYLFVQDFHILEFFRQVVV